MMLLKKASAHWPHEASVHISSRKGSVASSASSSELKYKIRSFSSTPFRIIFSDDASQVASFHLSDMAALMATKSSLAVAALNCRRKQYGSLNNNLKRRRSRGVQRVPSHTKNATLSARLEVFVMSPSPQMQSGMPEALWNATSNETPFALTSARMSAS